MAQRPPIFCFGEFELDEALGQLRRGDEVVPLQAKPLQLMLYLIHHREEVISKDQLLAEVWHEVSVSETALASALRDARKALGDTGTVQRAIETQRGLGYRFVAPVHERTSGPRATEAASSAGPGPFVGRANVIERIDRAYADAADRTGRIVLLAGEPGIGKTRTLQEFADISRARGTAVYSGWCYEGEGALPYWPWVQILRGLLESYDAESLSADLSSGAADLVQILPELRDHFPDLPDHRISDPDMGRFRLFDSVAQFLRRAAVPRVLVLAIDDLHYADSSSMRLLEFLAHELGGTRILLLASYRDAEVDRNHPFAETLAQLARHDLCQRISLDALDPEGVRQLVESLTGSAPTESFLTYIEQKTDGNPYFIRELVRFFETQPGADWPGAKGLDVPPGLREVVRGRLRGLSDACTEVLAIASVVGADFSAETVTRAGSLGEAEVSAALDDACLAGILTDAGGGRYRFAHTILQQTVYAEQTPGRRTRLHRDVGEALEQQAGSASEAAVLELARHFSQAASGGGADKAFDYAQRAGRRAMELLAFDEAADHYARALEVKAAADAIDRCDLVLHLADSQQRAGHRAAARESYRQAVELARGLRDAERLARSAEGFAGRASLTAVDESSVRLLEEALTALEGKDTPSRVRILVSLAGHLFSPQGFERAEALAREALESAERIADPATLASVLDIQLWMLWASAGPEQRYSIATRCLELAEQAGDHVTAAHAQLNRARAMLEIGDLEASDAELQAVARRVEEHRLPLEHTVVGNRAMRALLEGRFDEAERLSVEAHALARKVEYDAGDLAFGARVGLIRLSQGPTDEIASMADQIVQANPEIPGWRCVLALVYAHSGRDEEAVRQVDQLATHDFTDLQFDPEWLLSMTILAEVCARVGHRGHAEKLYELLRPHEARNPVMGDAQLTHGSTSRYLGLLADTLDRTDDAIEHFEEAMETLQKMGAAPSLAHTQYECARSLLRRRRGSERSRALELLQRARESAHELGMRPLVSMVEDLRATSRV
jgi:DNA-binding winged helix-turn-helix (wHTH) protein/tetratricopeptide (TPR) repeat protein